MKYEITSYEISPEETIDDDTYKVRISIFMKTTDNVIPSFGKDIEVISHNSQTGYEVDEQRQSEIQSFLNNLNL